MKQILRVALMVLLFVYLNCLIPRYCRGPTGCGRRGHRFDQCALPRLKTLFNDFRRLGLYTKGCSKYSFESPDCDMETFKLYRALNVAAWLPAFYPNDAYLESMPAQARRRLIEDALKM